MKTNISLVIALAFLSLFVLAIANAIFGSNEQVSKNLLIASIHFGAVSGFFFFDVKKNFLGLPVN